jgi:hypothetical protein
MAGDNQRRRIWDQPRNGRNGPVAGVVVSALALFGALMIGLAVVSGSMSAAGGRIDGWIAEAQSLVR